MMLMRTLIAAMVLLQAQDGRRITVDHSGSFPDAVQALVTASEARLRVRDGVDPKPVVLKLSKATFFEALDTLCRAHGKVRYFEAPRGPDEGQIELSPNDWIEYPSSYSEDFKVIVSEMAGFAGDTSVASTRFTRVYLSVWGPPWLRLQDDQVAKTMWTVEEARDAAGQDVLPPAGDPEPPQAIDLLYSSRFYSGNAVSKTLRLKPFDLDRGLQSLKGYVRVSVAPTKEVEIPFEPGKSAETPAGTLTVESLSEPLKTRFGPLYKAKVSLKPAKGIVNLRGALETRFRCAGAEFENKVYPLTFPRDGWSFEMAVRTNDAPPSAVRLITREPARRITVPFEFKNLRF